MRVPALYPSPAPTPLGCPQILKEPSLPTTPPQQRGRTSIIPYSLAPVNTFEASPFVLPRPGSTRPSHRFTHPLSAAAAREMAHCRERGRERQTRNFDPSYNKTKTAPRKVPSSVIVRHRSVKDGAMDAGSGRDALGDFGELRDLIEVHVAIDLVRLARHRLQVREVLFHRRDAAEQRTDRREFGRAEVDARI